MLISARVLTNLSDQRTIPLTELKSFDDLRALASGSTE
jgi:hypothetical protein